MRAYNERLVLTLIRQAGHMAKAEIARVTGLSAQTVSVIVRALEADGLLTRGAPVRGKVGQPSVPMALHPDGAFCFGLKVGRRSAEMVMADFLGHVRTRQILRYSWPDPDAIVGFARQAIDGTLADLPTGLGPRVAGLGIALPYRLWDWTHPDTGADRPLEAWRGRDIAAELGSLWLWPVYHCNDASAACGAELVFGDQDRPRDFLYLYVGAFAGGGVVIDNVLFTGQTGNSGALGSMPIVGPDGRPAQLVDVASLLVLEHRLAALQVATDPIWEGADPWPFPETVLTDWIAEAADGLAQAIVRAASVIDFAGVVIDGALPAHLRSRLVQQTDARMTHHWVAGIEPPALREGTMGFAARALGAASLPLSDRYMVDRNAFLLKG